MSTRIDRRHIFPFFNLPRELRDIIYTDTLGDVALELSCGLRLEASGVPSSHLLVVSQQMKGELQEQAQQVLQLRVKDDYAYNLVFDTPDGDPTAISDLKLPHQGYQATHLHLDLCVDFQETLESHLNLVHNITSKMHDLKTLSLRIGINFESIGLDQNYWRHELERLGWNKLARLTSLEIYDTETDGPNSFDVDWEWMLFKWDQGSGQLCDPDQSQSMSNIVQVLINDTSRGEDHVRFADIHGKLWEAKLMASNGTYSSPEQFLREMLSIIRRRIGRLYNDSPDVDELEDAFWRSVGRISKWAHIQPEAFRSRTKRTEMEEEIIKGIFGVV